MLTIKYVSAPPGTGKTNAAIQFMRQHILKGAHRKNPGFIFYVAPTTELLNQTLANLEKSLKNRKYHQYIQGAYGTVATRDKQIRNIVHAILDGAEVSSLGSGAFPQGSVLFLTHATFIKLRKHPLFQKVTVIFDEARKWAELTDVIQMDPAVEEFFNSLFTLHPLDKGSVSQLVPKALPHKGMLRLLKTKGTAKEFGKIEELYRDLTPSSDDPVRMQVYGLMEGVGEKRRMVRVTIPSHPFVGFKDVFILSADFETSQMNHLLMKEQCILKDVTFDFLNKHTKGGYLKALQSVERRYSQLTLVPLLNTSSMSSKYLLDGGLVLPSEHMLDFQARMNEYSISTRNLRDISEAIKRPNINRATMDASHRHMLEYMLKIDCHLDVLKWQVSASHKVAKRWLKKHPEASSGVPGLMLVNKGYDTYKLDSELYQYLDIGRVEGQNGYRDRSVVTFLAAVNPNPILGKVLSWMLPNYDAHEDFVVDKAIQSIGRGNIRDQKCDLPMLAIVSSRGLAMRILHRMKGYPQIDLSITEKLGNYIPWSTNEARSASAAGEEYTPDSTDAEKTKQRMRRYLENPINVKLSTARSLRSRWKKRLGAAKQRGDKILIQLELDRLEGQIAKLTKQRTKNND